MDAQPDEQEAGGVARVRQRDGRRQDRLAGRARLLRACRAARAASAGGARVSAAGRGASPPALPAPARAVCGVTTRRRRHRVQGSRHVPCSPQAHAENRSIDCSTHRQLSQVGVHAGGDGSGDVGRRRPRRRPQRLADHLRPRRRQEEPGGWAGAGQATAGVLVSGGAKVGPAAHTPHGGSRCRHAPAPLPAPAGRRRGGAAPPAQPPPRAGAAPWPARRLRGAQRAPAVPSRASPGGRQHAAPACRHSHGIAQPSQLPPGPTRQTPKQPRLGRSRPARGTSAPARTPPPSGTQSRAAGRPAGTLPPPLLRPPPRLLQRPLPRLHPLRAAARQRRDLFRRPQAG